MVNLKELFALGHSRAGHAAQLVIHPKEVLNRNRGIRQRLALNFYAFFGFDGLMQAFRKAPPKHLPPGELINNNNFALVADDVIAVFLVDHPGSQRIVQIRGHVAVFGRVDILDAQPLLNLVDALLSQRHVLRFQINDVIAIRLLKIVLHAWL